MKKLLLPCLILLTCLPSFGGGFNFWPESKEVECSVVLASEPVEAGKPFPDFTLVFTNKSRKEVLPAGQLLSFKMSETGYHSGDMGWRSQRNGLLLGALPC